MGKVATSPLPPGGCPPLQGGGQNQKWPTSGQGGNITSAAWGIPTALERGAKSEVAHKCDPTISTAPTNVYGRVSSAWVFPAVGTRNLGTVGLRGGHGVPNTPWG